MIIWMCCLQGMAYSSLDDVHYIDLRARETLLVISPDTIHIQYARHPLHPSDQDSKACH